MSIEDEAKKELERRNKEDLERKLELERRSKELEQSQDVLSRKNQALLATLNLTPMFQEVRDKYWKIGIIEGYRDIYNGNQRDYFGLIYKYEELIEYYGSDSLGGDRLERSVEERKIKLVVGILRISEKRADFKFEWNGRELVERRASSHFSSLENCSIQDGVFEDAKEIKEWIKKEITYSVIQMTQGDLTQSNIFKAGLEVEKKKIDEYRMRNYPFAREKNKGCWPFS